MTIIKFIGLFVIMYTEGVGYHVLFPHFNMVPPHPSIIAYRDGDRVGGDWHQENASLNIGGVTYFYVKVNKQNIVLENATGAPPGPIGFGMPHLTCCCSEFWDGFLDDYGNPNFPEAGKKGAHAYVNNGTVSETEFPPASGAVGTQFSVPTTAGITIRGTVGGSSKTIVLNPNAQVIFGNTPLAVLDGTYKGPPDDEHFRAFYKMGKKTEGVCNKIPSAPPPNPCAPSTSACPVVPKPKVKSAAKRPPARTGHVHAPMPGIVLMVDVDCSNSQWP